MGSLEAASFTKGKIVQDPAAGFVFVEMLSGL